MTAIALGLGFIAGVAVGPLAIPTVIALIVARLIWTGGRALLVPSLLVVVATCLGVMRESSISRSTEHWPANTSAVVGRVINDPTGPESELRFIVDVTGTKRANTWSAADGHVCVRAHTRQPIGYGDIVQLQGKPLAAATQSPTEQDYLAGRGCGASLLSYTVWIERPGSGLRRAIGDLRRRFDNTLMTAAGGDAGALLAGLVTGSDWHLSVARQQAFVLTSTSHITAVSGANLTLLITVLVSMSGALGARRSIAWDVAIGLTIAGYAAMTGFGAPVVRASIVAMLALLAVRLGRKPDLVTLLVLTATVMVAFNPLYLQSLSFRLSFVSSLALVLTAQRVRPTGVAAWAGIGLLGTAAADLATLPFLPVHSIGLPLVAIPANVLIGPLIEVAYPLACLVALVGLVSAPVATAIGVPAELICDVVFLVVDSLSKFGEIAVGATRWPRLGIAVAVVATIVLVQLGADGERFARRLWRLPRSERWSIAGVAAIALLGAGIALAVRVALP